MTGLIFNTNSTQRQILSYANSKYYLSWERSKHISKGKTFFTEHWLAWLGENGQLNLQGQFIKMALVTPPLLSCKSSFRDQGSNEQHGNFFPNYLEWQLSVCCCGPSLLRWDTYLRTGFILHRCFLFQSMKTHLPVKMPPDMEEKLSVVSTLSSERSKSTMTIF